VCCGPPTSAERRSERAEWSREQGSPRIAFSDLRWGDGAAEGVRDGANWRR
jgi:hypothetical protein